jgi:hypothetical protein
MSELNRVRRVLAPPGQPGRRLLLLLLAALLLIATGAQAGSVQGPAAPVDGRVTTPRDFLGYEIGQDYKLTPWQAKDIPGEGPRKGIVDYAHELDRTSDRVQVFEYGRSEEGRPMILTVITSPENWANMADLKSILGRLADPRQIRSDEEAKALVARGKAVYWMVAAIHASERTSPEVLMRLSYKLASGEDAWTRDVLDKTIIVIENSVNPDGLEMVTDWYYQYKGTPYDGSSPPYYNHYINHDNNRDYLGLGAAESQQNAAIRSEWHPTMYHDLHEAMVMLYMSPGPDQTNEAIHPITVGEWLGYAGHIMTDLIAKGHTGVFTYDYAEMWYPGFMNSFTSAYNSNAIFFELQGARGASPRQVTSGGRIRSWYNPAPITVPFTWRLIDAVNLEEDGLRASLTYMAQNKDELLYNFYLKGKLNMQKAAGEAPYAFIIPQNAGDNADVVDMINNLRAHLLEIYRAAAPFTLNGKQYAAGDFVIQTNQPFGMVAKNLLMAQNYVPVKSTFDVTGWTYGYLRDVKTVEVNEPLPASVNLIPLSTDVEYAGTLTGGAATTYAIEHQTNNNLAKVLPKLWADAHVTVAQADAAFTAGGRTFLPGTLVITTTGSAADHAKLAGLIEEYGLTGYALSETVAATALHQPKVGLYTPNNSTGNTMPEGWVRLRMDRTEFPYTRLYKEDVKANALTDYDVIIIPDLSTSGLVNGTTSSSLPPEYRGGIGSEGVANLKSFVENGGTLIAMGRASLMPIDKGWNVGVTVPAAVQAAVAANEVTPEEEINSDFPSEKLAQWAEKAASAAGTAAETWVCPGAVIRMQVDPATRVGYGYDAEEAVWCESSTPYFTPAAGATSTVVARYPTEGTLLLSGYVSGESALKGKLAIVDAQIGKGHVVLLAPNVLYRAQTTGTYMLFWNAVISGARPRALGQ